MARLLFLLSTVALLAGGCPSTPSPPPQVAQRRGNVSQTRPKPRPKLRPKPGPKAPDILPYGLRLGMTGAQAAIQLARAGYGSEVCAAPKLVRRRILPPAYLGFAANDVKCGPWPLHRLTVVFAPLDLLKKSQAFVQRLRQALTKKLGKTPQLKKHADGTVLTWTLPMARVVVQEKRNLIDEPGGGGDWVITVSARLEATRRFAPPRQPLRVSPRARTAPPRPRSRPRSRPPTLKKALGLELGLSPRGLEKRLAVLGVKVRVTPGQTDVYFVKGVHGAVKLLGVTFHRIQARFVQGNCGG